MLATKVMRRRSAAAAVAVVAVVAGGCGGSSDVVARVAGTQISRTSLRHWESIDAGTPRDAAGVQGNNSRGRALSFLILASWLEAEALKQGVDVSSGQAREQLETLTWDEREHLKYERLPRDAQLREYLTRSQTTSADRQRLMRLSMILARLEERRLSQAQHEVTPRQIADYYAQHKKEFWRPERRDLEVIGNSQLSIVAKAKREIEAGGNFLRIARRVSTDQEAPGGLEHPLARGEEEPDYDRVVFSAKPHKLVGPVKQSFYYIFEVIAIRPAHVEPLAQASAAIERQLAWRRASSLLKARFEQAWIARTACQRGYVSSRCRPQSVERS